MLVPRKLNFDRLTPPVDPEEDDEHGDREVQIEGSRLADVGLMKVTAQCLIPSVYHGTIQNIMWDVEDVRPPEISRI